MSLYLENTSTDPYYNMAVEEFLFHHFNEPVFHLWQNKPSVIIGLNQLMEAEVNMDFVRQNDIQLVRRFSGGGAVYQDLGNINLSFINSDGNLDFDSYNQRIIDFLISLGLKPTTNERRAIFIDNMKVSGSSQHVRGPKAVYHATLLFSSNLNFLQHSLLGKEYPSLSAKHVRSVKSPVTNLSCYFPGDFTIQDFRDKIVQYFIHPSSSAITLSDEDKKQIQLLKTSKYLNSDWINHGMRK